jgi:hypothetical protein
MIAQKFKNSLKGGRRLWFILLLSFLLLLIAWLLPRPVEMTPPHFPKAAHQYLGGYAVWADNPMLEKIIK